MKYLFYLASGLILLIFLIVNPLNFSFLQLGKPIAKLNSYRKEASLRCAGGAYRKTLGTTGEGAINAETNISEKLFGKGYGTGSLDIGITLSEKTELAVLLGNMSSDHVDRFLSSYCDCMENEMIHYYQAIDEEYPEKPNTNSIVWDDKIYTAIEHATAYATEISGNWRAYELCVEIPENALMDKESVVTKVLAGVPGGAWGGWRKDIQFVDNNAYGPTKVCRTFDHQIHDQNRELMISVEYRLPKESE